MSTLIKEAGSVNLVLEMGAALLSHPVTEPYNSR